MLKRRRVRWDWEECRGRKKSLHALKGKVERKAKKREKALHGKKRVG
jgi:hypothetical protein